MASIGKDIQRAADLLRTGEVVAIPTETVYGLAGNAFNRDTVVKIFTIKNRPRFNPVIVHSHSFEAVQSFVVDIPPLARALAEAYWPGPMTLLLPRGPAISDLITSGSPLVGIRVPNHPLTLELLRELDFPLAAPSANPFGYISPTTAAHVAAQLGDKIPYILDGGPTSVGVESTIVGFDEAQRPVIYRPGGLSLEDIETVTGPVAFAPAVSEAPESPGRLLSHYAPGARLQLGDISELLANCDPARTGILSLQKTYDSVPADQQIVLSPSGDLGEAAHNLFTALRQLDTLGLDTLLAEPVPEEGLGRAINDRLRRAAAG